MFDRLLVDRRPVEGQRFRFILSLSSPTLTTFEKLVVDRLNFVLYYRPLERFFSFVARLPLQKGAWLSTLLSKKYKRPLEKKHGDWKATVDAEIEKLIELVREATFIYDVRNKDHHDLIKITNFWNSVSTQFNDKCSVTKEGENKTLLNRWPVADLSRAWIHTVRFLARGVAGFCRCRVATAYMETQNNRCAPYLSYI